MVTTATGIATSYIQFTRASLATVTNNVGNIAWAGHNLLLASESFDAASWTKDTGAVIAANTTSAPNATTSADRLTASAGTGNHWIYQNFGSAVANTTLSVFAKAGTVNWIALGYGVGTPSLQSYFDLANVAVGDVPSGQTASILDVGSGWRLCSATFAASNGNIYTSIGVYQSNAQAPAWNAAGTENVFLWGASLYRSDLGGMVFNPAQPAGFGTYYPTTPPNLLASTEDYNNGNWIRTGMRAFGSGSSVNATTSPNGLPSADLITTDASNGLHSVSSGGYTIPANTTMTYSAYVKPSGYTKVALRESISTGVYASFSLVAGGSLLDKSASASATITALSDGWYRLTMTVAVASTSVGLGVYILSPSYASGVATTSWTSDGVSGIYLWGAQLSDSASIDPYSPVYGAAVTSSAYYAPRLDYSPTTIQPLGMLVEEQRTNLLTYSSEFDNAAWSKAGATAGPYAGVSPDGAATAEKILETATTGSHAFYNFGLSISAAAQTLSVYLRAAERTWAKIAIYDGTNDRGAWFNLSTGAVGTKETGVTAEPAVAVGNGWYRCSITRTTVSGTGGPGFYAATADNVSSYAGTLNSGILVWGAQLEANASFPTSYIPTGASTVTRSADVASVSTQAFPYSQGVGSLVVAVANMPTVNQSAMISGLNTSSYSNAIQFYKNNATNTGAGGNFTVLMFDGADTSLSLATSANDGNQHKLGMAWNSSGVSGVADGGTVQSGTYRNAQPTKLEIGGINGSGCINGHIRQITYLPRRVTNAELQTRTT